MSPVRPFPDELPPWYRSQAAMGTLRTNLTVVGGVRIPNDVGIRWYEETYADPLEKDHSEDATVRSALEDVLEEQGFPVSYAPRRDVWFHDFLAVVQAKDGSFTHNNPDDINEVIKEEHKIQPDAAREAQVRRLLADLGIEGAEYKCFYNEFSQLANYLARADSPSFGRSRTTTKSKGGDLAPPCSLYDNVVCGTTAAASNDRDARNRILTGEARVSAFTQFSL
ncbi:hypothetical protein GGX14DRAFT_629942 [Mycena pura]|uniref:Uncharacterized protein n=1 Tax=Mycena pura TaxID=153505 RepID=A0AAD7E460_9AGAR|nr:hypothetical protein GGX14DRAFT_629942 [Mycena pura]